MKKILEKLNGLIVIQNQIFKDKRGYFTENYNQQKFFKIVKKKIFFVQDNLSVSKKGVIRGMHYQISPFEQGKLICVVKGKIFDVAIDIRKNSKTYGKHFSIILSNKNQKIMWIPGGFAHGFMSLEDDTIVKYKSTKFWSKKHERSILWNDKNLNIKWPNQFKKIISNKDLDGFIHKKKII